jgi:hypothetical protein
MLSLLPVPTGFDASCARMMKYFPPMAFFLVAPLAYRHDGSSFKQGELK